MSLAKFSVHQAVFVNLLFWFFIVAGAVIYRLLPVDVYPDTSLDEAWIQTIYPGASPEDVEQHVTKKIEDEIQDINGVARFSSYSVPNMSNIFIKFDEQLEHVDYEASFQEVRNRLGRVTDLPEAAEEPLLTRLTLSEIWPILQIVIADDGVHSERAILEVTRDLKNRLRDIDGIAKLKEVGVREREIQILLDKEALERYQLSFAEVAAILRSSNQNIPGGTVETPQEEFWLLAVGNADTPDDLGNICIKKSPTGSHVYLRDIADISEGFERRFGFGRFEGKPSAFLYVAKKRHADSITIRNEIQKVVDEYRATALPEGVMLDLFADSTQMISSRLEVLKKNLGVGIVLVFVVLWMVIGARNSILAILGIPFSFLCAFIFMHMINVSLNGVSVFALVLVSGMIVDDAIVVLENIYRHIQAGDPLHEAIITGTNEVAWPVVSSALTTVAAFLPLLVMTGVLGRFFSIIPKTVTVALLASLFECLIILPNHYLHWGPRARRDRSIERGRPSAAMLERIRRWVQNAYVQFLRQAMSHRYLCLAVVAALGLCAYQAQRTLTVELFPSDFPNLVATFNIQPEASLEQTDQVCQQLMPILTRLKDDGQILMFNSAVGVQWNEDNQMRQRPSLAQLWVGLRQADSRGYDPEVVENEIRRSLFEFVEAHPDLHIENLKVWPIQDGPPIGKPVSFRVEHTSYDRARVVAERIKKILQGIDGVFQISDNLDIGQRELRMTLREDEASQFGLTFGEVFTTLSGVNEGVVVGRFIDETYDEEIDVRLKYMPRFRSSEEDLLDVDLKSPMTGALIKLGQVAELHYDQGYGSHFRYNNRRAVVVTADVDTHIIDAERANHIVLRELGDVAKRDEQLTIAAEGQFKETHDSFRSLWWAGGLAICLMYMILAVQFRNYAQPLIVLLSLTFGTIGMIFGLVVNDYPFSVVTGIAMVGLCGVMINDAILLVSFINTERRQRVSLLEALIEGCLIRARAIILTTVTTVSGLLPMALGVGGYNKIWSPFATCICWGLTSATLLILLFLPSFYLIIEDVKGVLGVGRRPAPEEGSVPLTA